MKRSTQRMLGILAIATLLICLAPIAALTMTDTTPTGTNLALQAVTAQTDSSYSASYTGANAKDGVVSQASKWCSTGTTSTHWLTYDLGTSRRVNGFIVRHAGAAGEYTSYNTQTFKIQSASSLSGPWTDECSVDNSAQANVTTRSYSSPKILRYVRLYITDPGTDNYARIPEFEVWCADDMNTNTPTGTNTALSATSATTDSSYSASYTGAKAKDGVVSQASKWCSTGTTSTHWLAYDLGTTRTVNGFIVRHAGAAGEPTITNLQVFKFQSAASLSGPWVDECSVNNSAQASVTARSFYTAKSLRYVRLYITDPGTDNYARVPEFEVISPSAGGGTISGHVRDGCYNAISGATVSTTTGNYSTTTNASGAYTLSNVAAGSYNVVASKSSFQTTTIQSETVTTGNTTTVDFQMPVSHSKFGWHTVIGGRNGFGTFLATTSGCGKPCAVIKGVDDLGACGEAKTYSSRTITIGRYCYYNGVDYNNLAGLGWTTQYTPQQAANMAYPIMKAVWDTHPEIDVWEIVNEWDSDYQWQADYHIAMMDKAEADGYRLGLFASSGGTPSETVYPDIARACARAKESGGHVLCLHEYGFFNGGLLQDNDTSLVTRYRQLYNYLVQQDAEVPILLTEVGQGGGYDFVGDSTFLNDHAWYDAQVRQDSYVLGVCAWTLGNWSNANAYTALDDMQTYICNN